MARKPIKQRIEFENSEKLKKDLEALGKTGEKAFADIQKAALKVDFTRFTTSLKTFGTELAAFGRKASFAIAGLGLLGGLSFTGISRELLELSKSAAEVADQTGKAAEKAGLTTEAFSKMAFAAEQNDVSQETLVQSLNRLNKQIAAAATGNQKAVSLFSQLGVAIKDANGKLRPTEDIVHDLAGAFSRMPDGVKKSTLAIQLFGRGGAALIPFLNEGKKGILELEATAVELGITLTEQQAKIGDALGDSLDKVSKAAKGIKLQLGLIFAPTFTRAADLLTQRISAMRGTIVQFGQDLANRVEPFIKDVINALSGNDAAVQNSAIIQFRDQIIDFGTATQKSITGIVIPAFKLLVSVLDGIAEVINSVFGTNFDGKAIAIALAVAQLTGAFRLLRAGIIVAFEALVLFSRHPIVAILIALAIRINGLIDKFNAAKAAAHNHALAMEELRQAVDDVKNNVPGAKQRLDELAKSHLANAKAALADAEAQVNAVRQELEIEKAKKPLGETFQKAQDQRTKQVEDALLKSEVRRAQMVRELKEVQAAIDGKVTSNIEDLTANSDKAAGAVKKVGDALDDTKKKAEDTGDAIKAVGTIKVTSFGGGEKTTQKFDVDASGAARARKSIDDLNQAVSKTDDEADSASTALDEVDDKADSLGTSADIAAPKVDKLNKALKDTGITVIHVADVIDQVATSSDTLGTASEGIAAKLEAAKGSADQLFATASNNAAGLTTVLDTTKDAAAGLGTALGEASTAAGSLDTSLSGIESTASAAADAIIAPFEIAARGIAQIMSGTGSVVRSGFSALQASVASIASSITAQINRILAQLRAAAAAAAALQRQANSGSTRRSQGERAGFAGGGLFRGAGTGTSDSNIIRVSDGEFIVRQAATKKFLPLLHAINSMRFNWGDLAKQFRGFSLGGLASSVTTRVTIPRMAGGGLVQTAPAGNGFTQPVHLHFEKPGGGETTVVVMAQADAPTQMLQFARASARNSTGRPQSWKGRAG